MNFYTDVSIAATSLAVNLLLFGFAAASGAWCALRLIPGAPPRARYLIVAGAFVATSILPTIVTLRGAFGYESPSIKTFEAPPGNQSETILVPLAAVAQSDSIGETNAPHFDLLNDFVILVGKSSAGIVFIVLWLVVSLLLLVREAVGHLRLRRARKNRWQLASIQQRRELQCPDRVPLYFATDESPCAVGVFRPAIVLPASFANDLPLGSRQSVVRHEAAHARWRDPLVGALMRVVRAAFWISPALWFLEHAARAEREAAADCSAVNSLLAFERENAAVEYAATLVAVAKLSNTVAVQNSQVKLTAIHFGGNSSLENRVRRLFVGYSKPTFIRSSLAMLVVLMSLTATNFLPVASQPLEIFGQKSIENQSGGDVNASASTLLESSSDLDFRKNFDFAENRFTAANQGVADDKVESKKPGEIASARNIVLAQPTPPANRAQEQKSAAQQKSEENKTEGDRVISPQPAQAVELPQPAVPPTPVVPLSPVVPPSVVVKPQP